MKRRNPILLIYASGLLVVFGITGGLKGSTQPEPAQRSVTSANSKRQPEILARASQAFNEVATKATPAVVSISSIKRVDPNEPPRAGTPPGFLNPYFPDDDAAGDRAPQMMGMGSGVIIQPNGVILTNNHVVENAEKITVALDERRKVKARVLGTDPKTDLAVIQIDGFKDLPTLSFGDSEQMRVGDWAIAIGSPFGLTQSVTFGIISAKGRGHMGILDIEDFIQTDAAINPGSSGGPLLNSNGDIIGINTAIFSQGGGFMGIGFAVPSQIAREVAGQLATRGSVSRGWIGLVAQDLDPELAKYFKIPNSQDPAGALISDVQPNGPANSLIQQGDVIVKYDEKPVHGANDLKSWVGKTRAGAKIPIEIVREGRSKRVDVTIQEQPRAKVQLAGRAAPAKPANNKNAPLGVSVDDVPAEIATFLKMPRPQGAMIVGVKPGGAAFEAGLAPGDIVLKANQKEIHNAREFTQLVKKLKEELAVLFVQRGPDERVFISVKPQA